MDKHKKSKLVIFLVVSLLFFSSCYKGSKREYDSEKDSFILSTLGAEGVFNPFFTSAQTDTTIESQTQIAMMTSDKEGNLAYGIKYPVVTLDYNSQFLDKDNNVIEHGEKDGFTSYQFVIKKGIKFSDGKELTIKDVLFNLYVYIDPVYTGSETIYSINIDGLIEYRNNIRDKKPDLINKVSGINVLKGDKFRGNEKYDSSFDVLEIRIKGLDPKAIWSFSFQVAPMHYYSNSVYSKDYDSTSDYHSFKYPDVDGVPASYEGKDISLGFPSGDYKYFTEVIQAVNKVPMGAGVYKCSTSKGYQSTGVNEDGTFKKELEKYFYNKGRIYFQRNEYFETTGGDKSEVYNSKIKYLQFKEIDNTNTLETLRSGSVYYGEPNCTEDNLKKLNSSDNLFYKTTRNNGYGYIGLSAKNVPNLNIRRAIMACFDVTLFRSYYPGDLCELLKVPMTTCSWIYRNNSGSKWFPTTRYNYRFSEKLNENKEYEVSEEFNNDMEQAKKDGYYKENGIWKTPKGAKLSYTFTIAGSSEDHPSYQTLAIASKVLNQQGFDITLKTDSRALSKITNGELDVWSAAWSATIDPDMYQVYHMDSTSTATKGWGYEEIKKDKISEEYSILKRLSGFIDDARATFSKEERAEIYRKALYEIMDLAIEFPTYNRNNLYVWNSDIIDSETLSEECTSYYSPIEAIWKVDFLKKADKNK